jgi:hypothetical protein
MGTTKEQGRVSVPLVVCTAPPCNERESRASGQDLSCRCPTLPVAATRPGPLQDGLHFV